MKREELIFETVTQLDALFLRKNPPLHYHALEFLAPVNQKVFIVNSINGLITGNSKLYSLNFPDIIPETHVSRDPKRLMKIIDDFGGAMVAKPLQRFGGEGVIKDGLFFVGIDVIGEKLVEINCVSPGGIPRINELDKVKLEAKVVDFVEQKIKEMKGRGH